MLGRGGGGQMMLPASMYSASAPNSLLGRYLSNTPEEDDETMSTVERQTAIAAAVHRPDSPLRPSMAREHKPLPLPPHDLSFTYRPPCSLPAGYGQPTPYPSRAQGAWPHPSFASSWSGYPNSLPSCPSLKDPHLGCSGDGGPPPGYKFYSLPGGGSGGGGSGRDSCMGSMEQPFSLHSNPPTRHHTMSPYTCPPQGAACCAQCPPEPFKAPAWPQYHPAYGQYYPGECRLPETGFTRMGRNVLMPEKPAPHSAPLPVEQRRVFVTYEADNDKHVNEIINFVALLRHNGFDTHIDIFEQQFRSISKIDFMERYLSEKEYLIIIIISPKYYETVTAPPFGLENDERTQNTVYIHKQLQNEFIQNGSKNFRFIPILFPGAKKCHVPNWLQNTHVYGWPRDRDDILRRLMRVEKYNPPPIGELPTIVSIPI